MEGFSEIASPALGFKRVLFSSAKIKKKDVGCRNYQGEVQKHGNSGPVQKKM